MGATDHSTVTVTADGVSLEGALIVPAGATGVVLFAHGSGSSRHSPRNNFVAERVCDRGGRVDMAEEVLDRVAAATLFIVGGNDHPVLEWNRDAYERLPGTKSLEVVEGASHLFEEPDALETVADHAGDWFAERLQ